MSLRATYLPAVQVQKTYAISRSTLRAWAEAGKIHVLRAGGDGKRLYKLADIELILGVPEHEAKEDQQRRRVCYARVSSAHQRGDLERQSAFLRQEYPEHELIQETGSGLNFKRPRFVALLDAIHSGLVEELVVTDKDRLCRFGGDLMQWLLDKTGTRLVVHGQDVGEHDAAAEPDTNHELSDDIISIITFFTARHNGQRSARNRKRRREAAAEEEATDRETKRRREAISQPHSKDSHSSHHEAASDSQ